MAVLTNQVTAKTQASSMAVASRGSAGLGSKAIAPLADAVVAGSSTLGSQALSGRPTARWNPAQAGVSSFSVQ